MEHGRQMYFNNHQLNCEQEKWKITLHYLSGHVYIRPKTNAKACNFTHKELKKLHYHCIHPSSGKLFSVLKRAYRGEIHQDTKQVSDKISEPCQICNEHSDPLLRFRASIPEEIIVFNMEIAMDLI